MKKKIISVAMMVLVLTILFLSGNFGKKQNDPNEKIKVVGINLPDRLEYLEQLNAGSETKQKDYKRKRERTVVNRAYMKKKNLLTYQRNMFREMF